MEKSLSQVIFYARPEYQRGKIMRFFSLIIAVLSLLIISGCYTQFASQDSILPAEEIKTVVDSTGDTIKVIERTDTIISREKETCVWERDMFGHPYLRCYDSYYPRDWYIYNNSPWWYRSDPFWFDYERCPRYYRYDPSSRNCVHYKDFRFNDHHHNNSTNNSSSPSTPPNTNSNSTNISGKESSSSRSTGNKVPLPASSPNPPPQNPPPSNQPQQNDSQNIYSKTLNSDSVSHPGKPEVTFPLSDDSLKTKKRDLRSLRSR